MSGHDDLPGLFGRLRGEVREARVAAILDEAREWAARQPAPTAPAAPPPPGFPQSWPMAIALADVVRWRDADFVRACYQAILRREPDPAGFALYLGEVRAGRSRVEIAAGFAGSEEGRRAGVAIAGLAAARWRMRLARIPVLGYLLRLAGAIALLPRAQRGREATEAYFAAQVAIAEARMADVAARATAEAHRVRLETAWIHERQARSQGARLARLADQVEAALARLPAVEAALSQVRQAGMAELAQATAGLRAGMEAASAGAKAASAEAMAAARQALAVAHEAAGDRETREARFADAEGQLADLREALSAQEARLGAALRGAIAPLEAGLERETLHAAAQDAQMQAVREAGMAELAQATADLEARLLEILAREGELLERRVAGRVDAVSALAREVEALRAALATFVKERRA